MVIRHHTPHSMIRPASQGVSGEVADLLKGFWCASLMCIPSSLTMCSTTSNKRFITCTVRTRSESRTGSNELRAWYSTSTAVRKTSQPISDKIPVCGGQWYHFMRNGLPSKSSIISCQDIYAYLQRNPKQQYQEREKPISVEAAFILGTLDASSSFNIKISM